MRQLSAVLPLLLVMLPCAVSGQNAAASGSGWTITLQAGIHADRLARAERVNRETMGDILLVDMYSARGEAPTMGVRATRWLTAHLGVDAGLELAHNSSWSGLTSEPATMRKLTLFSSLAPVWRFLPPASRLQLQLGVGPALITHTGTGQSLLKRSTDVGGMAAADASWPLSRRLRLVAGAQNYRFSSSFLAGGFAGSDAIYPYPAATLSRSEWVFQSGLRISF